MNTKEYLDAVKQHLNLPSDYALAARLGVTRSAISKLQLGKSAMGNELALEVASILKLNPAIVFLDMEKERAKDDTTRKIWQEITKGFWKLVPQANDRRRMPRPV